MRQNDRPAQAVAATAERGGPSLTESIAEEAPLRSRLTKPGKSLCNSKPYAAATLFG